MDSDMENMMVLGPKSHCRYLGPFEQAFAEVLIRCQGVLRANILIVWFRSQYGTLCKFLYFGSSDLGLP